METNERTPEQLRIEKLELRAIKDWGEAPDYNEEYRRIRWPSKKFEILPLPRDDHGRTVNFQNAEGVPVQPVTPPWMNPNGPILTGAIINPPCGHQDSGGVSDS